METSRGLRRGLGVVLTVLTLSGCLAGFQSPAEVPSAAQDIGPFDALSEKTHGFGEFQSFDVKSFDGTPIHVDLTLPDGEGPFPTILEYTPYYLLGGFVGPLEAELLGAEFVSEYVGYGYAVGTVHVRGTGESGGCLTIGGPNEGKDGYSVVEHIANQSWSNGKVAMLGTSYVGTTPLETAILQPPHLAAIVPISGVTEWYRYYFEQGTHRRNGDPFPGSSDSDALLWGAMGLTPGVRTGANGGAEEVACAAEFTQQDLLQDDYNAYWKTRDITKDAANITTAVLYAHGWQDWNVAASVVPGFLANLTNASQKHAWLQQHGHGVPGSKKSFYEFMHRFLDENLLDKNTGSRLLPEVIVEDNLHQYRAESSWPPADANVTTYYPATGWKMDRAAPSAARVSYRDDATGSTDAAFLGVNHVRFVSGPLDAALHIAGTPRLHLKATLDMPGGQFDVLLFDRASDGKEAYVSRGYLDARHRESLEHGKDVPTGTALDYAFDLHPNDHVVAKGHSLVLVVKSTDDYVVRSPFRVGVSLDLGEGTFLALPTIEDGARWTAKDSPTPWIVSS